MCDFELPDIDFDDDDWGADFDIPEDVFEFPDELLQPWIMLSVPQKFADICTEHGAEYESALERFAADLVNGDPLAVKYFESKYPADE